MIRFNNVRKTYPNGTQALKGLSFELKDGEFAFLVGPSGAGKSTILSLLTAEEPISGGSLMVNGYNLNTIRPGQVPYLRRSLGIVFQDFQLLTDRTVYDNLMFVLQATGWKDKTEMDDRIEEVLKEVGMLTKSYKMPHELSGGEQQRIVIARALLNKPKLILADEPTGNLDPATGEQIVRYLHDIAKEGTAVIMATHNFAWLEQFPGRLLRCSDKHIVEESNNEEKLECE